MKRRAFLGAAALGPLLLTDTARAATKHRWKMTTSWSPRMPILQDSAELFAKWAKEATGGKVRIKVFAGGELIPPLSVFDAVSAGNIEVGHSAPYYWAGKIPSAPFFSAVPFGMTTQELTSWLQSGGNELWAEAYKQFNLVPMSVANTGTQMGGWFKRELKTASDLKGLKIRIPGLGGKVMASLGANVILMPGSEVFTALERGTIDATEWISPFHDMRIGLHSAAEYYYYPGWHEPSSNLELMFSSPVWGALPNETKRTLRCVADAVYRWTLAESALKNAEALAKLKQAGKVKVLPFPKEITAALRVASKKVLADYAKQDTLTEKVYTSYAAYQQKLAPWNEVSEEAYLQARRDS